MRHASRLATFGFLYLSDIPFPSALPLGTIACHPDPLCQTPGTLGCRRLLPTRQQDIDFVEQDESAKDSGSKADIDQTIGALS